jgi:hypothetical protein
MESIEGSPQFMMTSLKLFQSKQSDTQESNSKKGAKENKDPGKVDRVESESKELSESESATNLGDILDFLEKSILQMLHSKGKKDKKKSKNSKSKEGFKMPFFQMEEFGKELLLSENEFLLIFLIQEGHHVSIQNQKFFDFYIKFETLKGKGGQENVQCPLAKQQCSNQSFLDIIHRPDFKQNFRERLNQFKGQGKSIEQQRSDEMVLRKKEGFTPMTLLTFRESLNGFDQEVSQDSSEDVFNLIIQDFRKLFSSVNQKKKEFEENYREYVEYFDEEVTDVPSDDQIQIFNKELESLFKNSVLKQRTFSIGLLIEFINGECLICELYY